MFLVRVYEGVTLQEVLFCCWANIEYETILCVNRTR